MQGFDPCKEQLQKAIGRMQRVPSYCETKPLALLVRNGCGTAFRAYMKELTPRFRILVPDDGVLDTNANAKRMVPKLIEKSLALVPELIITNSRGVGYAHEALISADISVSRRICVLVLSSGSSRGPLLLQEHPGRVVCLHGHHDDCTPITSLRNALDRRKGKRLEPAVLFEIMNRGHEKKHGWELGGLAHWALQSQQIQCSHECIHFPPSPSWPSVEEEAKWKAWFLSVCQADPSQCKAVADGDWRHG